MCSVLNQVSGRSDPLRESIVDVSTISVELPGEFILSALWIEYYLYQGRDKGKQLVYFHKCQYKLAVLRTVRIIPMYFWNYNNST